MESLIAQGVDAVRVGSFLFAAIVMYRLRSLEQSRATALLIAWVLILSLPFWVLFDASFVVIADEGETTLPLFVYLAQLQGQPDFLHAVAGGVDPAACCASGREFLSLEVSLFRWLPVWAAYALHKIMCLSIAVIGTYLLARWFGATVKLATVSAMAYCFAHAYIFEISLHHGIGYASIPFLVWLIACRTDLSRPIYWTAVLGLSLLYASSTTITHSFLSAAVALPIFALLVRRNLARVAGAIGLFIVICLANWAPVIDAFLIYAPYSARAADGMSVSGTFGSALAFLYGKLDHAVFGAGGWVAVLIVVLVLLLARIGVEAFGRREDEAGRIRSIEREGVIGLVALGLAVLCAPLVMMLPWDEVGMGYVLNLRLGVSAFSVTVVAIAVLAQLEAFFRRRMDGDGSRFARLCIALPSLVLCGAALELWVNSANKVVFAYPEAASMTAFTEQEAWTQQDWRTEAPSRAITIPYRAVPMAPIMHGLEIFDGYVNLIPAARSEYWQMVRQRARTDVTIARSHNQHMIVHGDDTPWVPWELPLDLSRWVDVDLLRVANVEYVFSWFPIETPGLKLVAPGAPVTDRQTLSFWQRRLVDYGYGVHPKSLNVYAIENPLPRAFFAADIQRVEPGQEVDRVYDLIASRGPQRVVITDDPQIFAMFQGVIGQTGAVGASQPEIRRLTLTDFGFALEVDVPGSSVLVVNTPFLPFWTVTVDGDVVEAAAVNRIHLAFVVPAGAKSIEVRYARPSMLTAISP